MRQEMEDNNRAVSLRLDTLFAPLGRRAAPTRAWLQRTFSSSATLQALSASFWDLTSATLAPLYMFSMPALARVGFCTWPVEPRAAVSGYIDNGAATALFGAVFFFPIVNLWRFGGAGVKAAGEPPRKTEAILVRLR